MTNYLQDIIINDALVNSGFRHVRLLHDHAPSHTSDACEVLEDYRLAASTILFRSSPMRHFLSPKQKFFFWCQLQVSTNQYPRDFPKSAYRDICKK